MKLNLFILITGLTAALAAGCAHYTTNQVLTEVNPSAGYRWQNLPYEGKAEELVVILAFSGGGTRAASLSYGVLEELARTEIVFNGKKRRLLDEIDLISSVSGGSFTAAYYGLFGDRIFEEFEEKFLYRNLQGRLVGMLLSPWQWCRLGSPYYNRDDMAADYYNKKIFQGKTFSDLHKNRQAPFLILNASDISLGSRFEFTQNQFDLIYSDLDKFPVARAVAASSAVPGLFGTVRLINHSHEFSTHVAPWIAKVQMDQKAPLRLKREAKLALTYSNAGKRRFIHLVDGGVTDNLGLRGLLTLMLRGGVDPNWKQLELQDNVEKVLLVIVDSHVERDRGFDRTQTPGLFKLLGASSSIPMNHYSFETLELTQATIENRKKEIEEKRNQKDVLGSDEPRTGGRVGFYKVLLQFNNLPSPADTEFFKSMPTSFKLKPEAVDRLRSLAASQLTNSIGFQEFLKDLKPNETSTQASEISVP